MEYGDNFSPSSFSTVPLPPLVDAQGILLSLHNFKHQYFSCQSLTLHLLQHIHLPNSYASQAHFLLKMAAQHQTVELYVTVLCFAQSLTIAADCHRNSTCTVQAHPTMLCIRLVGASLSEPHSSVKCDAKVSVLLLFFLLLLLLIIVIVIIMYRWYGCLAPGANFFRDITVKMAAAHAPP